MDKKLWINLGLLAAIIIIALGISLTSDEREQKLLNVSDIDSNTINRIEVIRKGLDDFIFNKQGESWFMESPLQYKANEARINAMLQILNAESHSQLDPIQYELTNFNLSDPAISIKLNEHEFRLGGTDAIDQRRYILFNNTIHLTNDFLYTQLTTNAAFFADTRVLPEGITINAIQFPNNKIELIDQNWQTEALMDISPDQLKRLVFSWQNATAISVSRYSEPEEKSLITISSNENDTIELVIVSTEPHLILGRSDIGLQYHMGSDEADKLLLKENTGTVDTETGQQ